MILFTEFEPHKSVGWQVVMSDSSIDAVNDAITKHKEAGTLENLFIYNEKDEDVTAKYIAQYYKQCQLTMHEIYTK